VARSRFQLFSDAVDASDPLDGSPGPIPVATGWDSAVGQFGSVFSTVEHHAGGDVDPDDPIDAGSGISSDAQQLVSSAGQPVGSIAQLADYLVNGYWALVGAIAHHWANNVLTYNPGNLNASEQNLALSALTLWSQVANIAFVQAGTASINFNHNGNMQAFTSSNWNGSGQMTSATIDISSNWIATYSGGAIYSYGFQTYIHEIGHALGLGHQGPYNGSGTYGTSNIYANDTWQFSVMSYFSQPNYDGGSYDYVITPQMADITAVQSIYGAPSTRAGDTTYGFNGNAGLINGFPLYDFTQYSGTPALTIYDSGGSDTLDCSGYSQNQTIDLTSGAFCSVGGYVHNVGIFTTTVLEGAIGGGGSDSIVGNNANNMLSGGGGNDTITGATGNDAIDGGAGTDTAIYAACARSIRSRSIKAVGSTSSICGRAHPTVRMTSATSNGSSSRTARSRPRICSARWQAISRRCSKAAISTATRTPTVMFYGGMTRGRSTSGR
jgi:serralysin